ncbi:putative ankyrin repeat-containing protein [Cadophora sp. MPI-SDFR-AT-0126]|nr:putative ankyrin repeat-containing protein [Leotiomycetes sp. MPI-SDFR-AT-0126]
MTRSGKRQAALEQTRLREAENQARESQQHKARSEVSPHDLHFRSPKSDTHKPGPESLTSDQNLRNIPSMEPMEPFGTTTFGNDVVSASDELTWGPEDYLKTTTVDIDVTNAYSNLGEKTQGHLWLDSASLSIGCTAMTTTTRYSPSSPTKARNESNTGKENDPHSQTFAAFHNAYLEVFSGSYGVSNRGKTALHISAERANGGIVRLLILHGVDVNSVDSWGRTALHYACGSASVDVVTQLLNGGADPDVRDHEGRSPLHAAVEAGCDAVVCLLAQEGADLNAVIGFGSGGSVQDSFEVIEA